MQLTGTFLDEISADIPHQNWDEDDWDSEFQAMRRTGIDTVIMIRCGLGRWIAYPSAVLMARQGCFSPPRDLPAMFLRLAEKHGLAFFFGTYVSGQAWNSPGYYRKELDLNRAVADEAWERYGHCRAFKGWYLSIEISRRMRAMINLQAGLGRHCKAISGGLPTLISPGIDGVKAIPVSVDAARPQRWSVATAGAAARAGAITPQQHEREWDEIMAGLKGAVDIVAFQDGHVDFHEVEEFLKINKALGDRHGLQSWTNTETFDRDMPIKFLPIKWEKLLFKLTAARRAGMQKAVTFEFSHFMSPNSSYLQARGLHKLYCRHFGI